jgi:CRP-like cAMP-binding protein
MDDDQLARIPILARVSKRDRQRFVKDGMVQRYAPGQVVVREGDPGTRLFLILEGSVRVEQAVHGDVATLGPGNFFGELALIEQHGRTATVTAIDELELLSVTGWEFRASLEEHPEIAVPMLEELIRRLHRTEHDNPQHPRPDAEGANDD